MTSPNIKSELTSTSVSPNIHIDRLRVRGVCHHVPVGTVTIIEGRYSSMPVCDRVAGEGSYCYVHSRRLYSPHEATEIELHFCPPQQLQGHNVFGHADLIAYACEMLKIAVEQYRIRLISDPREAWQAGKFAVTEVHLTGNFYLQREHVCAAIQAIDENNTSSKHRDGDTSITLGFTPRRRSRTRAVTVYDKYAQLKKAWKVPGPLQRRILEEVKDSIRAEVKLYCQGLARAGLNEGFAWRNLDVSSLFFENLHKFKVCSAIQRKVTEFERAQLSFGELKALQLWLAGVCIFEQFRSRSVAYKYIREIWDKIRLDISGNRRPDLLPIIDLWDVFAPENLLPTPRWLRESERYVAAT